MDDGETLPEAFWGVARSLRHLSRETLSPWDITPSHGRALGVLTRHGVLRLTELAEHLHIAPRSATEVVDALQERGLVERRADPQDRRATLVALTAGGQSIAEAIHRARAAEAESFFGALSTQDQADLARILRALHRDR
jgi:DNA-binding MarR family transcriptional regulator